MRITYRDKNHEEYWADRWRATEIDTEMTNLEAYPLKYAEMLVAGRKGKILEAGCGAGRILNYYHKRNYDIVGIDYIEEVIEKIKTKDPSIKASFGDIKNLNFASDEFDYVMAFGIYHNIEQEMDAALAETLRVMKPGGRLCASFRADNLQNRINDWLYRRRNPAIAKERKFHKINLKRDELVKILKRSGFEIEEIHNVENMPLLYKFSFFRSRKQKRFNERLARAEGYQLSNFGRLLYNMFKLLAPDQSCNLYVVFCRRA